MTNVKYFRILRSKEVHSWKIKGRSDFFQGNARYDLVQHLLVFRLLSINVKIKIHKKYNFTSCFAWVHNLVSHIKARTQSTMSENKVPRRTRASRTKKPTGRGRKLLNEELHYLYSTLKSRKMVWPGYVKRMGRWEMHTKFWLENETGKDHSADVSVEKRAKLKLKEHDWMVCTRCV